MTKWQSEILIKDLHDAHRDGSMTIKEVGTILASRCKLNRFVKEWIDEGEEIAMALEELTEGVEDVDHYDYCLRVLYDFGDYEKRIWFRAV